jgi:hypothetical protein
MTSVSLDILGLAYRMRWLCARQTTDLTVLLLFLATEGGQSL